MIKFLLDVLQLVILVKLGYSFVKWLLSSKKRQKKSIARKIVKLATNRIHYHLDNALRKQRKAFKTATNPVVQSKNAKVIPIRQTK